MDAILNRRGPSVWERFINNPTLFLAQNLYVHGTRRSYWRPSSSATVRVICISDTHNQHESTLPLPDGDILVHAGDITQSGTEEELERALAWLHAQPHPFKVFIAGNHDHSLGNPTTVDRIRNDYPELIYLEDSEATITVRGRTLNIYGSPRTPRHGSWSFQYPRIRIPDAQTSTVWASIPLHTDILVTHGPPAHHLDNNGSGCVGLLSALWRVQPSLHVFGHIHSGHGIESADWDNFQKSYERICESGGGIWHLVSMLAQFLTRWWNKPPGGKNTTLVNASVLGGHWDELRRKSIVVDI